MKLRFEINYTVLGGGQREIAVGYRNFRVGFTTPTPRNATKLPLQHFARRSHRNRYGSFLFRKIPVLNHTLIQRRILGCDIAHVRFSDDRNSRRFAIARTARGVALFSLFTNQCCRFYVQANVINTCLEELERTRNPVVISEVQYSKIKRGVQF